MIGVGENSTMWRVLLQPYYQGKIHYEWENRLSENTYSRISPGEIGYIVLFPGVNSTISPFCRWELVLLEKSFVSGGGGF